MQRVELLTALEQQLGGEVPEAQLAEIYTVRDLVDAILEREQRREGTRQVDGARVVHHFQRAGDRS